ncbi:MAG TPA: hypothetical protein VKA84_21115 [Gemmatimonadaceae bacterium]|nr:hypothetical protein [Gemmatimonadaceae bacterium]
MHQSSRAALLLAVGTATLLAPPLPARAQSAGISADLYREMRWRMIGPHRGGRTKAASGIRGQPNVFYVGAVNGGVWKTTDYGRTWLPIFDDQPTGSVGAIAIAPSDPSVIYVGSGEGLQRPDLSVGNGVYKSTDGGRSWTHLGLRDGQQIPQIVVHPTDPNRLFVAVLGHPYGPNAERGLFRSADGGQSFQRVLYRDENTGAVDVALDPSNPDVVYAVLWESRQAPWENGVFNGPGSGLYKSTDGGQTWRQLTQGLPAFADGLGRIGVSVAPRDPRRLYATVEVRGQGYVYRSDDAGEHWMRTSEDTRVATRPSDFAEIKADPKNADVVYSASVVTWKSTDAGRTWTAFRGAPGGDDYHRIWINPDNPDIILIAADQGAIITVNGGQSWSSWYNQPTAEFYHVSTDNAFPYRVCGGQQESGSACVESRGDYGAITFREWTPVAAEEYGYVAPDPLDPDVVYGGKLTRWDRRTRQARDVTPKAFRSADYRVLRTAPVLFDPLDPRTLYFASNTVWKTTTGGRSWTQISPDLTRQPSFVTLGQPGRDSASAGPARGADAGVGPTARPASTSVPPNVGKYAESDVARATHPGVVYTLAPSPVRAGTMWAGTDDGLIHLTVNGGATWRDVTPAALRDRPWSKISLIDASHTDPLAAYAAVNTLRLDDLRPHIYRTRDGGRTWAEVVAGIDSGTTINAVREDPKRKGLLFAGSEAEVWVSFDDGDHWQSLRLNMPATSIRDLVIKDDDLVVGTHGRSFWILDDITPLRQVDASTAAQDVVLFRPQTATRWRWNLNTDTPLPPDEPQGENPPDGAIVDYWVGGPLMNQGPTTLEILDAAGRVVRRYASTDTAMPPADIGNTPRYWIRPTQTLSAAPGMHRFVWDLRYERPAVTESAYPISAVYRNTPREPRGPFVVPGTYTVRLTANGKAVTQPLAVRLDPRAKATPAALARQLAVSRQLTDGMRQSLDALGELRAARKRLASLRGRADADSLDARLAAIEGGGSGGQRGGRAAAAADNLARLHAELQQLYETVQGADAAPTTQVEAAVAEKLRALRGVMARWDAARAVKVD